MTAPHIPVFYRLKKGKKLFSFGEEIGDAPILNLPLSTWQEKGILQNKGKLLDITDEKEINDSEYFIFDEDLFFSSAFISAVIKIAISKHHSFRTTLSENTFNERFVLPHSAISSENLSFNFFYINKNVKEINPVIIPQKLFPHFEELPDQIVKGGKYHFDQCDTLISRLASPFHLLQINLAQNFSRMISIQRKMPQWFVNKFAPVFSMLYIRSLKSLNKFGKGCRVHPSAIIENAELGKNVIVGANDIIRHSFIGDGCKIHDNVSIMSSVLGKNNVISNGNHVNLCLTYNDVFLIHGPYQFSVFGKSSAVFAVINCDIRLDQQNIFIPTDCGILDSKQPLLGIAYGHYSKTGGGNIIASGRIIPNHKHILPPENVILKKIN